MPDADLYDELQVSRRASPEVIDAAYRRLARMYHPDTGAAADVERMVRINHAYEILSDPRRRADYDARSRGSARSSSGTARAEPARNERPAGAAAGQRSFLDRAIGAARLDSSVYEEVRHGRRAGLQALAIIIVGSVAASAAGLGSQGASGLIPHLGLELLGWAIYVWLIFNIGARRLAAPQTNASPAELTRTLAFANGPRVLLVTGIVPFLRELVGTIVAIWVLITTIIAVQAALDFGTGRAIIVGTIGWSLQLGIFAVAGLIAGIGG